MTAIGAGTTYPDYKPALFIVASQHDGVDMVTVVTEGIFSYCGAKVKIDTDRHIGPERSLVRVDGEPVGHVTTGEYGSQCCRLVGESFDRWQQKEGRVTCATLLSLCNGDAVDMQVDEGSSTLIQAGEPPIINGLPKTVCGWLWIGHHWYVCRAMAGLVDEVVIVDDHITGVMSEHQAGKVLGWKPSGIKFWAAGQPRALFSGGGTGHGMGRHQIN